MPQVPAKNAWPFDEKAIQVKADVAAALKIIASVGLHTSLPTNGRSQPAAAPVRCAFAFAPFPSRVRNGPETSRARDVGAAQRTLDGEDRSGI